MSVIQAGLGSVYPSFIQSLALHKKITVSYGIDGPQTQAIGINADECLQNWGEESDREASLQEVVITGMPGNVTKCVVSKCRDQCSRLSVSLLHIIH